MSLDSIIMPYKENCKVEGEVITRFKIAKLYFGDGKKKKEIADYIGCHYNTVNNIIAQCKEFGTKEAFSYLRGDKKLSAKKLELFSFLKSGSRAPKSNKRCLSGKEEQFIIKKQGKLNYGPKRMFNHLNRQGYDTDNIFTFGKIKGVYKRNNLITKKIRTSNGNRRALYNYAEIGALEYFQYDTKHVVDQDSLPPEIYNKFKRIDKLPNYQWTIVDAKTKARFLGWSYDLTSFFGYHFLEFVICWLRAHGIRGKLYFQIDRGSEMCSGSERKLREWNKRLSLYNVEVYDTDGIKWKQNLVERTHRIDDEEFYCPRGEFIETKSDFLREAQYWILYYNHRSSEAKGLDGVSPKEKLYELGIYNAEDICNFPCLILEDFFEPFQSFFSPQKSQNVLTYYLCGCSPKMIGFMAQRK